MVSLHLNNEYMVTQSDGILEKDCRKTAAQEVCGGSSASSSSNMLLLIGYPPPHWQSMIRRGNKEDTLPLMKLKQSRPLASKASHWPPVSSRGGSSDGGEGYGFSVTVCTQRGLNLGLEHLGLIWLRPGSVWTLNWSMSCPDSAQIWPGSTITCMCPNWLAKEACRGGVVVEVGVIYGIYAWPAGSESLNEGTSKGAKLGQGS